MMTRLFGVAAVALCLVCATAPIHAAGKITCAKDDVRHEIDVASLAIHYQATGLEATLNGLSVLGAKVAVAPKPLQQAAAATQKLNEFVKALAAGYNSCAIGKQTYEEGIKKLLPAMQSDGKELEALRQQLLDDRKIDAKKLEKLLTDYNGRLRRLAEISGRSIDYERIGAIVDEQIGKHTETILQGQNTGLERVLARLDQLERGLKETPLPTPQQVKTEISAIKRQLLAKADEAEAAYDQGYALMERYRFAEAIPHLKKALAAVKLPDFYMALGRAYRELPDLELAERILREGLAQQEEGSEAEAILSSSLLGGVLQDKGDLDGALAFTQRALKIDEKVYGSEYPNVAIRANNIGLILQAKGDLNGALAFAQKALKIDEKVYGPEHPNIAIIANNIGQILQDKGDLDGALAFAQRALKIDKKVYGQEHPNVARDTSNIGMMLKDKGDLDGALDFTQRALKIDEKVFGTEHPKIAIRTNNIGTILYAKGDLDGALAFAQRALKIDEKVYGQEHPKVAIRASNIGMMLKDKGDLDGALAFAQRALKIDEKVFVPESPNVAIDANNIGLMLKAKGDLDGALAFTQRALKIFTQTYGADNPSTKTVAGNVEEIRSLMKK